MMIYTGTTLSFQHNGKFHQAHNSHPSFTRIVELAKEGNFDEAARLIDVKTVVAESLKGTRAELKDENVYFDGEIVRSTLARRIITMAKEGFDATPLLKFLENLMDNPSKRAVDELYGFLEASQLPITDDGHFLAYKSVRQDFTDHHTGTMDNSVGALVEMPRNKVDEDKDRTCSTGLHFAAHEYAKNFGASGRMVVLKINPKDVVAIPSDYNNQKGRACKYLILEEVDRSDTKLVNKGFVPAGKSKETSVTFSSSTYEPQESNYDDDSVWDMSDDHFIGEAKEFPVNRDVTYLLYRESTEKAYTTVYFVNYDVKNDNLVFKYMEAGEVKYCTVKDLDDWEIETQQTLETVIANLD